MKTIILLVLVVAVAGFAIFIVTGHSAIMGGLVPQPTLTHLNPTAALTAIITPPSTVPPIKFSSWLWNSPDSYTKLQLTQMFQIAKTDNVNLIYVRMDDYGDIYGMASGTARTARLKTFNAAARQFITLAKNYGISVQALGGDTDWAEPTGSMYPPRLFQGVLDYNAANPDEPFVGIQFDVEANNSAAYKINKTKTLVDYLSFMQAMIAKKPKQQSFAIGFTAPMLYAEQNSDITISWKGQSPKMMADIMADILNTTTGGYIAFMDYRNYAQGADGSIDHAQSLMDYVSQHDSNVKIVIGQEVSDVTPAKITFYGMSKQTFNAEVAKIVATLQHYPEFGGVAIQQLPSYIDL